VSSPGRLLGVDPGAVRIGLAVSDPDRKIASPLTTHVRRDVEQDALYFQKLVEEEQISAIVVGLPLHMDGREGTQAVEARTYGQWLAEVTQRPVVFWDERCTTAAAESALWNARLTHRKRKQRRDQVAATILLQAYLDAGCPEHTS
jgi:putative Holliday junction resolvase